MINEKNARDYCCEDISLIENYEKALNDDSQVWVCHHRNGIQNGRTLSHKELDKLGLYFNRPASELIFLTRGEHKSLHGLNRSEEHRQKISKSNKGRHHSEETIQKMIESHKGMHYSEETRQNISESLKGNKNACGNTNVRDRIWINNGQISKRIYPQDLEKYTNFVKGRLKKS